MATETVTLSFKVYSADKDTFRQTSDIRLSRVPCVGEIVCALGGEFLVIQARHFDGTYRQGELFVVRTSSGDQIEVAKEQARTFVSELEDEYEDWPEADEPEEG